MKISSQELKLFKKICKKFAVNYKHLNYKKLMCVPRCLSSRVVLTCTICVSHQRSYIKYNDLKRIGKIVTPSVKFFAPKKKTGLSWRMAIRSRNKLLAKLHADEETDYDKIEIQLESHEVQDQLKNTLQLLQQPKRYTNMLHEGILYVPERNVRQEEKNGNESRKSDSESLAGSDDMPPLVYSEGEDVELIENRVAPVDNHSVTPAAPRAEEAEDKQAHVQVRDVSINNNVHEQNLVKLTSSTSSSSNLKEDVKTQSELNQSFSEEYGASDVTLTQDEVVDTKELKKEKDEEKEEKQVVENNLPKGITKDNSDTVKSHSEESPSKGFLDSLLQKFKKDVSTLEPRITRHRKSIEPDLRNVCSPVDEFFGFDESDIPGMFTTPRVKNHAYSAFVDSSAAHDLDLSIIKANTNVVPLDHDGMVCIGSEPPALAKPKRMINYTKPRTVAQKRKMLEKKRGIKFLMMENEAKIYTETNKKRKGTDNYLLVSGNTKVNQAVVNSLQTDNVPFRRDAWTALSWLKTEPSRFWYKVLYVDDIRCKLIGSKGNYDANRKLRATSLPLPKIVATHLRNGRCCKAVRFNQNWKINLNLPSAEDDEIEHSNPTRKLLDFDKLLTNMKPGPLRYKLKKQAQRLSTDECVDLGPLELVRLPPTQLEVRPKIGRPLDASVIPYLRSILAHESIPPEWAKFAVSVVNQKDSTVTDEKFTFHIPYENDHDAMHIRRRIITEILPKYNEELLNDLEMSLDFAKAVGIDDDLGQEVAQILTEITNSVAISLAETSFCKIDPDIDYDKADKALELPEVPEVITPQNKSSKNKKVLRELRRLNAKVITADTAKADREHARRSKRKPLKFADYAAPTISEQSAEFFEQTRFKPIKFKDPFDAAIHQLRHVCVTLRPLAHVSNIEPWCMVHRLYKCFCLGTATEGKPFDFDDVEAVEERYEYSARSKRMYEFERHTSEATPKKQRTSIDSSYSDRSSVKFNDSVELKPVITPTRSKIVKTTPEKTPENPPEKTPTKQSKIVPQQSRPAVFVDTSVASDESSASQRVIPIPAKYKRDKDPQTVAAMKKQVTTYESRHPEYSTLLQERINSCMETFMRDIENQGLVIERKTSPPPAPPPTPVSVEVEEPKKQEIRPRIQVERRKPTPTEIIELQKYPIRINITSEEKDIACIEKLKPLLENQILVIIPDQPIQNRPKTDLYEAKINWRELLATTTKQVFVIEKTSPVIANHRRFLGRLPMVRKAKECTVAQVINILLAPDGDEVKNLIKQCNDELKDEVLIFHHKVYENSKLKNVNEMITKAMKYICQVQISNTKHLIEPQHSKMYFYQWTYVLQGYAQELFFVWEVKLKGEKEAVVITLDKEKPKLPNIIVAKNIRHLVASQNEISLVSRMLLLRIENEKTKTLGLVLFGAGPTWRVCGFMHSNESYLERGVKAKPTPATHPKLAEKISQFFEHLQSNYGHKNTAPEVTQLVPDPAVPYKKAPTTNIKIVTGISLPNNISLPMTGLGDHRWLMLQLIPDFSDIFVPSWNSYLSYGSIINAINLARTNGKTVRVTVDVKNPEIYATPDMENRIFIGPYDMDESTDLILCQNYDGKIISREEYQERQGTRPRQATVGTWLCISKPKHRHSKQLQHRGDNSTPLEHADDTIQRILKQTHNDEPESILPDDAESEVPVTAISRADPKHEPQPLSLKISSVHVAVTDPNLIPISDDDEAEIKNENARKLKRTNVSRTSKSPQSAKRFKPYRGPIPDAIPTTSRNNRHNEPSRKPLVLQLAKKGETYTIKNFTDQLQPTKDLVSSKLIVSSNAKKNETDQMVPTSAKVAKTSVDESKPTITISSSMLKNASIIKPGTSLAIRPGGTARISSGSNQILKRNSPIVTSSKLIPIAPKNTISARPTGVLTKVSPAQLKLLTNTGLSNQPGISKPTTNKIIIPSKIMQRLGPNTVIQAQETPSTSLSERRSAPGNILIAPANANKRKVSLTSSSSAEQLSTNSLKKIAPKAVEQNAGSSTASSSLPKGYFISSVKELGRFEAKYRSSTDAYNITITRPGKPSTYQLCSLLEANTVLNNLVKSKVLAFLPVALNLQWKFVQKQEEYKDYKLFDMGQTLTHLVITENGAVDLSKTWDEFEDTQNWTKEEYERILTYKIYYELFPKTKLIKNDTLTMVKLVYEEIKSLEKCEFNWNNTKKNLNQHRTALIAKSKKMEQEVKKLKTNPQAPNVLKTVKFSDKQNRTGSFYRKMAENLNKKPTKTVGDYVVQRSVDVNPEIIQSLRKPSPVTPVSQPTPQAVTDEARKELVARLIGPHKSGDREISIIPITAPASKENLVVLESDDDISDFSGGESMSEVSSIRSTESNNEVS